MISVVIPTVTGREDHLTRCEAAYRERSIEPVQIIVVRDRSCCGDAWNAGAELAEGDFLHWTADDLEPHEGWDRVAVETVLAGEIPAPVIYRPGADGLESVGGHWASDAMRYSDLSRTDRQETTNTSVVPFCSRATWEEIRPMLPAHYYTDNYFTDRCRQAGYRIVIRTEYAFTHHWASEGRGAGAASERERMAADKEVYLAASGGGGGLSEPLQDPAPGRPVRR